MSLAYTLRRKMRIYELTVRPTIHVKRESKILLYSRIRSNFQDGA